MRESSRRSCDLASKDIQISGAVPLIQQALGVLRARRRRVGGSRSGNDRRFDLTILMPFVERSYVNHLETSIAGTGSTYSAIVESRMRDGTKSTPNCGQQLDIGCTSLIAHFPRLLRNTRSAWERIGSRRSHSVNPRGSVVSPRSEPHSFFRSVLVSAWAKPESRIWAPAP
jgi:hypothetical protein